MQVKRLIPWPTEDQIVAFWARVLNAAEGNPDICWTWKGPDFGEGGYGSFPLPGGSHPAHRVAYLIWHNEQPGKRLIRHSCNNPPCCNPCHLIPGTAQDNVDDMKRAGRDNHWGYRNKQKT